MAETSPPSTADVLNTETTPVEGFAEEETPDIRWRFAEINAASVTIIEKKRIVGPTVTRQDMIDFLKADAVQKERCGTLPVTFLIWFVFVLGTWLQGDVKSMWRARECIHNAVGEIAVSYKVTDEDERRIVLGNVSTTDDVWTWIGGLVDVYSGSLRYPRRVGVFNQLVGEVQLRQRRVKAEVCRIDEDLVAYYGTDCYIGGINKDSFGDGGIFASRDPAFLSGGAFPDASAETMSLFVTFLDARRPIDASLPPPAPSNAPPPLGVLRMDQLRASKWVDDKTDWLEVRAMLFNAEVNMLTYVDVTFDFQRGGLVTTSLDVRPFKSDAFPSVFHVLLGVVWALCMLALAVMTVQAAVDQPGEGCFGKCCGNSWVVLDWAAVLTGFVLIFIFLIWALGVVKLEVVTWDPD